MKPEVESHNSPVEHPNFAMLSYKTALFGMLDSENSPQGGSRVDFIQLNQLQ